MATVRIRRRIHNFLTDEEQDIQREIYRNTTVDTSSIVERIGHMIFGDIYTTRKYRYGKYDFAFDQMVDTMTVGTATGGMRLRILTVATDAVENARSQRSITRRMELSRKVCTVS